VKNGKLDEAVKLLRNVIDEYDKQTAVFPDNREYRVGVAQGYFDLRQFDMQLEIAQRTLQAWEESVRIGQARLRQGVINRLDVDQFEAERENAAARIAELKRQMVQKENELSVLLGKNPKQISRGRSLTEQVMPPVVPAGLPSELLQRRPDVVQAEQGLAAATARIGMAKADRFPKLSITGTLGIASPQLSRLVANETFFGAAGPSLAGPLFNAQILGFQQKAAEAQARQALAQYEQTILVAHALATLLFLAPACHVRPESLVPESAHDGQAILRHGALGVGLVLGVTRRG
jgi:multidrug efflux system outer membrane protein